MVADTFFKPGGSPTAMRNLGFPLLGMKACEAACSRTFERALLCFTCFQTNPTRCTRTSAVACGTQVNETTSFSGCHIQCHCAPRPPTSGQILAITPDQWLTLPDGGLVMTLDVAGLPTVARCPAPARKT